VLISLVAGLWRVVPGAAAARGNKKTSRGTRGWRVDGVVDALGDDVLGGGCLARHPSSVARAARGVDARLAMRPGSFPGRGRRPVVTLAS
jgi:hypothetical protein